MTCGKILADILFDCNTPPKGGIEQTIVLINREDINKAGSTIDSDVATGKHTITSLALNTGATGYNITGLPGKQIFTTSVTPNVAEDQPDDFTHAVNIRLFNCNETSASLMNNLAVGADLVAVVRNKSGCIEVFGWDAGLKLSEGSRNSNENRGSWLVTLSSTGTDTEPKTPYIFFNTDEATSIARFEAKFA